MTIEEIEKILPYENRRVLDLDECETGFSIKGIRDDARSCDYIISLKRGKSLYKLLIFEDEWELYQYEADGIVFDLDVWWGNPQLKGHIETLKYREGHECL